MTDEIRGPVIPGEDDNDPRVGMYRPRKPRKVAPAPEPTGTAAARLVEKMMNSSDMTAGQWEEYQRYLQEEFRQADRVQGERLDAIEDKVDALIASVDRIGSYDSTNRAALLFVVRWTSMLLFTSFFWASDIRKLWLPNLTPFGPVLMAAGALILAATFWNGGNGKGHGR